MAGNFRWRKFAKLFIISIIIIFRVKTVKFIVFSIVLLFIQYVVIECFVFTTHKELYSSNRISTKVIKISFVSGLCLHVI